MAEIKVTSGRQGQTKIKNVPIAVTPEGFWCCPSPVVFQKSLKAQNPLNKPKPPFSPPPKTSVQKKPVPVSERRASAAASTLSRLALSEDQQCSSGPERTPASTSVAADRGPRPKIETLPRKVAIEFGEPRTCDMKVVLLGKQGFCVKLSVHRDVLTEKSSYFADKLSGQVGLSCLQIDDHEDVEIYVETVGLMYCKEMKQRLIKQSVSRILRILKVTSGRQGQTKIKNVPIAVTPEGFWCCPSPVVFQKSLKAQNPLNKPKPPFSPPPKTSVQKKPVPVSERRASAAASTLSRLALSEDQQCSSGPERTPASTSVAADRGPRPKIETLPRKVAIEFGEPRTCDMKVVLLGKQGFCVKLSVHRDVLTEKSSYFADKLSGQVGLSCLQIDDHEDVEIYVETVGLMYCKEMKQRLIKQSVSRILRILKVAEYLGFSSCIQSCLEYLEAVPWVGDEEEEKVVSTVLQLQAEGIGVNPVLKRVSSDISKVPKDTLFQIIELVLKSNQEKGRREMKSVVLKLLRENNSLPSQAGSAEICNDMIYGSCRSCLDSLLSLFKQAAEPAFSDILSDHKDPILKHIALEADNLLWLLEILIEKQAADEFALMWANQQELAALHAKLPVVSRYNVSCISGRLFVGIGRGQLLPSRDTRLLLLQTWLQPLMNDYNWLQHGCRSFDTKLVEEGIGRTILTLPLEDQQSILLSWLGSFLKTGDSCPNLERAFEVWWRRTFIRPHVESQGNALSNSSLMLSKQHE